MPDSLQRVTVEDVWNVLSRAALRFCICPPDREDDTAAASPQWSSSTFTSMAVSFGMFPSNAA